MKIQQTTANFLMIFIAIAVLIIPASVISYSEYSKVNHVIAIENQYDSGFAPDLITPINQSITSSNWGIDETFDTTPGNYFLYARCLIGQISTRDKIAYKDGVTYTGNNTFSVSPDVSDFTPDSDYAGVQFMVVLDINNTEWANFDFIRLTNDKEMSMDLMIYRNGAMYQYVNPNMVDDGNYLFVHTISATSILNQYPDNQIYLRMTKADYLNSTYNETISFTINAYNFTDADSITWSDSQVYILTILGCDIIMIVGFVFTTNFIDVKFDRSKPKRRYKRKR